MFVGTLRKVSIFLKEKIMSVVYLNFVVLFYIYLICNWKIHLFIVMVLPNTPGFQFFKNKSWSLVIEIVLHYGMQNVKLIYLQKIIWFKRNTKSFKKLIKNRLGCQCARLDTIILNKDNLEFYNENKFNFIRNK